MGRQRGYSKPRIERSDSSNARGRSGVRDGEKYWVKEKKKKNSRVKVQVREEGVIPWDKIGVRLRPLGRPNIPGQASSGWGES